MKRLLKKSFVFVTVVTLVFGLTGCAEKRECNNFRHPM